MKIKKNLDKVPTISINGNVVKVWKNGEYGSIGLVDGAIVFHPYCYDEIQNQVCEYTDDKHPNIILATGFTAYQYAHPDDAESMKHYYDDCMERYKASLRYKASFRYETFAAKHLQTEKGHKECSEALYDYLTDNELQELSEAYLNETRSKYKQHLMATELTPFFKGEEPYQNARAFVHELFACDGKTATIANIVKRWSNKDDATFNRDMKGEPLRKILIAYNFKVGSQQNWSKHFNR